jgi:hypothetical protein
MNNSVFCSDEDYENIEAVKAEYPEATVILEIEGGWVAFKFYKDEEASGPRRSGEDGGEKAEGKGGTGQPGE